jgi:hypothetical protein
MRTINISLCTILFALAGCGDTAVIPDLAMPDLAMPDLTPPPDLAKPDFAGVSCGTSTCGAGSDCCLLPNGNGGFSFACMAAGSCQVDGGGGDLMCDGPEDCPMSMADCCVGVDFQMGSDAGAPSGNAQAQCVTKCVGTAMLGSGGMGTLHTKLCHTTSDCDNFQGMIFFNGTALSQPFTSCCQAMQTGNVTFCAPAAGEQFGAYTCQH